MKRTTITLSDELARAVEREVRRRRISLSELVREALAAHMGLAGDGPRPLPFAALGASGHRSTARDFEEVLAAEWARDRDR
jgi:Arc/MetJ-type ribon-helix-helix transcriptional regulator